MTPFDLFLYAVAVVAGIIVAPFALYFVVLGLIAVVFVIAAVLAWIVQALDGRAR